MIEPHAVPPDRPLPGGLPRALEWPLAALLLLLALPLLLLAAAALLLSSPGEPVLFVQERVGRGGRPFRLFKLRTMSAGGDLQLTARGDARVGPLGALLRATKLNELPNLWNVLRGELSFVGPRPEVPRYVVPDDPRWQRVLEARPGLVDGPTLRLFDEEGLLAGVPGDLEDWYAEKLLPFKLAQAIAALESRSVASDLAVLGRLAASVLLRRRPAPVTRAEVEAFAATGVPPVEFRRRG